MTSPAPPQPAITILAEDLFALQECRVALADLVHVIESEPKAGLTSTELRDGYEAWLHSAVTRARLAAEVAETLALPPQEVRGDRHVSESVLEGGNVTRMRP